MRQSFVVPGRLDGLNEYTAACRASAKGGGKLKRRNQDMVRAAIRESGLRPMRTPVFVSFTWVEGKKDDAARFVPRDKDNIRFAAKFVLDALVEEGIIPDDGWRHVEGISDAFMLNRNEPKVVVTLEEVR